MKNLLPGLTALLALFVCATSCTEDITETAIAPESHPQTRTTYNKHLSFIESMGFSTTDIIEEEDCYVVEGDIVLPKTAIDSLMQLPQTRQARYKYKIEHGWENGIRVKITSANITDAGWLEATRRAIDIWNAVPDCPVYFYKITKPILVHDTRVFISNKVEEVADADYPIIGGLPGKQLRINPAYNYFSLEEKTYVLVHEFGHILGLAHTDFKAPGQDQSGRTHIAGTPESGEENDSVMHHAVGGRDWGNNWGTGSDGLLIGHFTGGDILAIQNLYGTPNYSITIDGSAGLPANGRATYTIVPSDNLQNYTSDFNTTWTLDGGVTEISSSEDQITVQATAPGSFAISALVDYNGKKMIDLLYPIKVMIGGTPSPPLTISADTTSAEYGEVVTFTASRPVPGMSYEWRVDGQIFESTSVTMQFEMLPTAGSSTVVVDCRIIYPGNNRGSWCNPVSITIL